MPDSAGTALVMTYEGRTDQETGLINREALKRISIFQPVDENGLLVPPVPHAEGLRYPQRNESRLPCGCRTPRKP
ncbi:hypothetical protein JRQ81_008467 [Phrynocephalus forsythii]|uniref:Uncharacterized protein n=1 Tax=Phrynocephalus forsythii TaxID=171643 RepID=A0A9Q1ASP9_9SAUR|nr:hypothetical protein JRQ81_008467 [Phrynocephalus forsythii]